jgi:hypothetical protein
MTKAELNEPYVALSKFLVTAVEHEKQCEANLKQARIFREKAEAAGKVMLALMDTGLTR